ncbi:hypothetical protein [Glycomyces artemisiae]|uniref:Uncharacterized protein n=1 Tax=Glycomyces artemisiae TaxID=1076443 RepID=A0A2T0UKD8_9ACTN|nr:hypothetical protein [Glycomyces artemisiae]PRY58390.1 hypothetical protein B0I28_105103 [Glycomyces artemisiae]
MDTPETLHPPRKKPVYQHPMPWQVVVALVLIGLDVLSRAATTVLTFSPVSALGALIWIALAVCIAARLDRARNLAMWFNLLSLLLAVLLTFAFASVPGIMVLTIANGVFALGLIYLLGSEASKRYTYRTSLRSSED